MSTPHDEAKETSAEMTAELSIDQAIRLAVGLQQRLALDDAERIYRRILELIPEHPDALHFLGVLQHQCGRSQEAIQLISQALKIAPEYVDAHNNLGNILREQDRLDKAEACYRQVLELTPENAGAYNNLGTVLRATGRLADAETAYRRAIELDPDFPGPYQNMGNLLSQQGRVSEAVAHYSQAIVLDPNHPGSKRMLGIALSCLGRVEEAAKVFREWAAKEPDNPVARHLLAACSGNEIPERAPDAYVKQVFDNFAGHFEERLGRLDYRAPQLIAEAVARMHGEPAGNLDILDAGCGTGLCGPLLRPYARKLEGVDLSPGMLSRARSTGSYDGFIASKKAAYDVIVSADTLCYFGDLRQVMVAAAGSLRPGGHFIFTVEQSREDDDTMAAGFRLNPNGRYSQRETYVCRTVCEAGLETAAVTHETLRQEMGLPVAGLVVTAVARAANV
jgi:predicted TPR repeat methyltransferase